MSCSFNDQILNNYLNIHSPLLDAVGVHVLSSNKHPLRNLQGNVDWVHHQYVVKCTPHNMQNCSQSWQV